MRIRRIQLLLVEGGQYAKAEARHAAVALGQVGLGNRPNDTCGTELHATAGRCLRFPRGRRDDMSNLANVPKLRLRSLLDGGMHAFMGSCAASPR